MLNLIKFLLSNAGINSLYVICCISAMTIRLASSKRIVSFHVGLTPANTWATRLCSRTQIVCITISCGCSVALESPRQTLRQQCENKLNQKSIDSIFTSVKTSTSGARWRNRQQIAAGRCTDGIFGCLQSPPVKFRTNAAVVVVDP